MKSLFLSLFSMAFSTIALASPIIGDNPVIPWVIDESRDDFDDSLLSLSTLVLDTRRNGGWLSLSCDLESKRFTMNIVSDELGRRLENTESLKNNIKYVIDKGKPKFFTATQVIQGTAIGNDFDSKLVKDIIAGGKSLKVQFLGVTGSGPVAKFNIEGALPAVNKIIDSCR